jgi:exonuclease III
MLSLLFWNIAKNAIIKRVALVASHYNVDVLVLAECAAQPADVLAELNTSGGTPYCFPQSESRKILIFTRLEESSLIDHYNNPDGSVTIRRLKLKTFPQILLVAAHLPSKLSWDPDDQEEAAKELAREIEDAESARRHERTILLADLNMNPFEPGVVMNSALHAVMTRDRARERDRVVRNRAFRFFYNPMWGLFGDLTTGPPGTIHYSAAKPVCYFWNMFDQVLLRPDLMDKLVSITILDSDGTDSLLTDGGFPDKGGASDHLPVLVQLDLEPRRPK